MAHSARQGDVVRGVDGGDRLHTPIHGAQLIASREHPLPLKPACGRVWHLEGAEDRRFELVSRGFQPERRGRFDEPITDPRGRGHDPCMHRNGVTVLLTRLRGLRGVASARQGPSVIHPAVPIGLQKHAPALGGTALLERPAPSCLDALAEASDEGCERVGVEACAQMERQLERLRGVDRDGEGATTRTPGAAGRLPCGRGAPEQGLRGRARVREGLLHERPDRDCGAPSGHDRRRGLMFAQERTGEHGVERVKRVQTCLLRPPPRGSGRGWLRHVTRVGP
jgi:hypothetical protein